MKWKLLSALALLIALSACKSPNSEKNMPTNDNRRAVPGQQYVLVEVPHADSVQAKLTGYHWDGQQWQQSLSGFDVVIGKNGLAWGHTPGQEQPANAIPKREGDGRAPAGIFILSEVFGYADQAPEIKMPYRPMSETWVCVDDVRSRYYNAVFDAAGIAKDWSSAEDMLRDDDLYRWGIVVDYNKNPATAGSGSCIFMHHWRNAEEGTAGCTAMAPASMQALLQWLDAAQKPVLIQGTPADLAFMRQHYRF
jgi:D-alanyl-D-alanine dipeptidase